MITLQHLSKKKSTSFKSTDESIYHLTLNNINTTRTASDFRTLDRASRRDKTIELQSTFPTTKFFKMNSNDDPRSHTKTIAITNTFLQSCHNNASHQPWWASFLTPATSELSSSSSSSSILSSSINSSSSSSSFSSTTTIHSSSKKQQARKWNQYFTREKEAQQLITTALEIIDDKKVKILLEPAAGTGSLVKLFPKSFAHLTIDIDPELCTLYGWKCADFLTLTKKDLGLVKVKKSAVCVITNPPYVLHGRDVQKEVNGSETSKDIGMHVHENQSKKDMIHNGVDTSGSTTSQNINNTSQEKERDGNLIFQFIQKSLLMADTCVCLCPVRFTKQHTNINIAGIDSYIVGDVLNSKFDLGIDKYKSITQPTVIVVYTRTRTSKKRKRKIKR